MNLGNDVHVTTAHIPKRIINWKKILKWSGIIGLALLIIFFPYEIGNFIGTWIYKFKDGLGIWN